MSSQKLKFPFEFYDLEPEVSEEIEKHFKGERGFVQVGPEKYCMPMKYKTEAERYYNFEARPDDVWIVTFPRSGTTFTQEFIWLVANNFDYAIANKMLLDERFPFFEYDILLHPEITADLLKRNESSTKNLETVKLLSTPGYEKLNRIPTTTRRFIKTHLPFSLLPLSVMEKGCKVIYVMREDVKKVAVSYYHLNRKLRNHDFQGGFERFWPFFERGLCLWGPYHSHIKEALRYRDLPNVLFLKYEEMLRNLDSAILKMCEFFHTPVTENDIKILRSHLDIENFRKNDKVNLKQFTEIGLDRPNEESFIRKGALDGIPPEFGSNQKLLERANKWIEENAINTN